MLLGSLETGLSPSVSWFSPVLLLSGQKKRKLSWEEVKPLLNAYALELPESKLITLKMIS